MFVLSPRLLHAEGDSYTHPDYKFRLSRPDKRWRLLDQDAVLHFNETAAAGAMRPGVGLVVVVEEAPTVDLGALAEIAGVPGALTSLEQPRMETVTFAGLQAKRVEAKVNGFGMTMTFRNTMFKREGFIYQVQSWRADPDSEEKRLDQDLIERSFVLLPGVVTSPKILPTFVKSGPGWRVASGVYESAIWGVRIRANPKWRIRAGKSVDREFAGAELAVGADSLGFDIKIAVHALAGEPMDEHKARRLREIQTALGTGNAAARPSWRIGRFSVPMARYAVERIAYWVGFIHDGSRCIEVFCTADAGLSERVESEASKGISAVEFLPEEEVAALRVLLSDSWRQENEVGLDWYLRRGEYVDLQAELRWRRNGGYWEVFVGSDAQRRGGAEGCRLFIEDPQTGVTYMLLVVPDPSNDADAFHTAIVSGGTGEKTTDAKGVAVSMGGRRALRSHSTFVEEDVSKTLIASTWVVDRHGYVVLALGGSATMAENARRVSEGLACFEAYAKSPKGNDLSDSVYVDRRMGFSIASPDPSATFTVTTPENLRSIGVLGQWRGGRTTLDVAALCLANDAGSRDAFLENIIAGGLTELSEEELAGSVREDGVDFLGERAVSMTMNDNGKKGRMLWFYRDNTYFMIAATGGAVFPPSVAYMSGLFRFIE